MIEGRPTDDPGWAPAIREMGGFLIPVVGAFRARRMQGRDGLLTLRSVFLAFVLAIALIGLVVIVLDSGSGLSGTRRDVEIPGLLTIAAGVTSLWLGRVIGRRPLDCATDARLAATYRTRFFLTIAVAESAALIAFVMFILTSAATLYAIGAVFTLIGFATVAPTAARLQREQEQLQTSGCRSSLLLALRGIA